jgi:group I intron endonuclease
VKCCIYKIRNKFNNKVYIGQTIEYRKRISRHKSALKNNKHKNAYLQNSYNFYENLGCSMDEIFEFSIIMCPINILELTEWEQAFLDIYREITSCYNIGEIVDSAFRGCKHSDETKNKIREKSKAHRHTQESKIKMSIAHKGVKNTENQKNKISEALKGRIFTQETLYKMSEAKKGRFVSEETRMKLKYANIGKIMTEEVKQKISLNTMKIRGPHTEERKLKLSIANASKILKSIYSPDGE